MPTSPRYRGNVREFWPSTPNILSICNTQRLVECNDNIHRYQCADPCTDRVWEESPRDLAIEQLNRYNAWMDELRAKDARVAVLEIGAGSSLPAIRRESKRLLSKLNATLIRINPRAAEGEAGTISIPLPALKALAAIEAAL